MNERLQSLVDQLERNAPEDAEGVARAIAAELGAVPGGVMYYLYMLQDDPEEFVQRVEGVPTKHDRYAI